MLLLLSFIFVAAATFAVAEVATYPARLKERSIKRAAEYGRLRVPEKPEDLVRFRERVLAPAAERFAAIPLKLNPRMTIETISSRLLSAGLSQRITPTAFLAVKGGATVAGATFGLMLAAFVSPVAGLVFLPLFGALGFQAPEMILSSRIRTRREAVRGALPDA